LVLGTFQGAGEDAGSRSASGGGGVPGTKSSSSVRSGVSGINISFDAAALGDGATDVGLGGEGGVRVAFDDDFTPTSSDVEDAATDVNLSAGTTVEGVAADVAFGDATTADGAVLDTGATDVGFDGEGVAFDGDCPPTSSDVDEATGVDLGDGTTVAAVAAAVEGATSCDGDDVALGELSASVSRSVIIPVLCIMGGSPGVGGGVSI